MNGTYTQSANMIGDVDRAGIGHSNGLGMMLRALRRMPRRATTAKEPNDALAAERSTRRMVTVAPRPLLGAVSVIESVN